MSGTVVLKQPLLAEELDVYKAIFKQLDNEDLSIITGDKLKPLFIKSKVPNDKLAIIWQLADTENKGFLTFEQFAICCRLIGFIQYNNNNPQLSLTPETYQHCYKVADLSGNFQPKELMRQPSFNINRQASNTSLLGRNNAVSIPNPTSQEISQFSQLFDNYAEGNGTITGDSARTIFQKSNLPTQALVEIWALADQGDDGYLTRPQFIVAMHLLQLLMNSKLTLPLPASLPSSLWDSVAQNNVSVSSPQLSKQNSGIFQPPVRIQSPLQRNLTNNSLNVPVENWVLTAEKCRAFDAIFESLDKSHSGKLGTDILVPYFLESGLSQDILAIIWDLADIQNNAVFSSVEFSIAMFLIQKTNAGIELPDIIPQSLLNSSIKYHQEKKTTASTATIPSRDTKPVYAGSTSPLNDLLSLDNTGFSSSQAHQSQSNVGIGSANSTGNSFPQPAPLASASSNNITPVKKFKPASTFGQSIIPEEPPSVQQPPQVSSPGAGVTTNGASSPLRYNYTSALPAVPNFSSLSSPTPSRQFSSTAGDSSLAVSNATTEIANLSTQVRSLSNQTKLVQDRKARAEQELAKITATKVTIESRLASLRQVFASESALAEQAEQQSIDLKQETDALEQELQVLETNYMSVKNQHETTNNSLNALLQRNSELKQRISDVNAETEELSRQLDFKKQEILKHEGLVSVNEKQLEMSDISSANLQNEILLIGQHFESFHSKKQELDQYSASLAQQHQLMTDKHRELEEGFQSLQVRQQDLEAKTAEIEKQEQIYNENVQRLQELFNDFQNQQERLEKERNILEENELKLENERNMYLQKAHAFATEDFDVPLVSQSETNAIESVPVDDVLKKDVSSGEIVDENSHLLSNIQATNESKDANEISTNAALEESPAHDSNIDDDASKSVDVLHTSNLEDPVDKGIPGGFEESELTNKTITELQTDGLASEKINEIPTTPPPTSRADLAKQIRDENASFNSSIQNSPKVDAVIGSLRSDGTELVGLPISGPSDEEFPPIKELEIDESDSSDDEDEASLVAAEPYDSSLQGSSPVIVKDMDEFEGLEPAVADDDDFEGLEAAQVVDDDDEDDEEEEEEDALQNTNDTTDFSQSHPATASNPEWDSMFDSLNKNPQQHVASPEQPNPMASIAISPRDLAIEELTDMGFAEDESKEALEKFNWHLESAAQYLANKS